MRYRMAPGVIALAQKTPAGFIRLRGVGTSRIFWALMPAWHLVDKFVKDVWPFFRWSYKALPPAARFDFLARVAGCTSSHGFLKGSHAE